MEVNAYTVADPSVMRAMGFLSKPANEAKKTWPIVSAEGDDVWWHPKGKETMWVQGLPFYEQLFSMIYHSGRMEGDMLRMEQIQYALGLKK